VPYWMILIAVSSVRHLIVAVSYVIPVTVADSAITSGKSSDRVVKMQTSYSTKPSGYPLKSSEITVNINSDSGLRPVNVTPCCKTMIFTVRTKGSKCY